MLLDTQVSSWSVYKITVQIAACTAALQLSACCTTSIMCSQATACIGLRQAMATFGALLGASIAGLAYQLSGQNYVLTFALSTVPAVGALLLVSSVS